MKKFIALISAMVMLGSAVSCSDKKTPKEKADVKKKIGIAMPTQELERWNKDGDYLKAQFEEAGYDVELKYSDNNADVQNTDIKTMLEAKVDLLIIAAVDGESLSDTLKEARSAGVTVIAYDRLIMNTDAVSYYVSFDNYTVGKLQGEYVREALDLDNTSGPYNIEFVAGDISDNNAKFFFDGAYETLQSYIESGKLIVKSGKNSFEQVATEGWKSENARANMKDTIASDYSDGTVLDAVVCANDSTALGVAEAIGTDYKGGNSPVITGQDGDVANLKNIVDGKQSMTVYKNVSDEASASVVLTKELLSGNKPDAKLLTKFSAEANYDTGTYNNGVKVVPAYLLIPYVITKDNLQQLADTGFYKWDEANKYLELIK